MYARTVPDASGAVGKDIWVFSADKATLGLWNMKSR